MTDPFDTISNDTKGYTEARKRLEGEWEEDDLRTLFLRNARFAGAVTFTVLVLALLFFAPIFVESWEVFDGR